MSPLNNGGIDYKNIIGTAALTTLLSTGVSADMKECKDINLLQDSINSSIIDILSDKKTCQKDSIITKTGINIEMLASGINITLPDLDKSPKLASNGDILPVGTFDKKDETIKTKEISSQDVANYLSKIGLNPINIPGITIENNDLLPGFYQEDMKLSDLGLSEKFTEKNIGEKFENTIKIVAQKYPISYISGDWIKKFNELSPNNDEVDLLNKYVSSLPSIVKPIPTINGMTGLIATHKYATDGIDFTTYPEAHKVVLNSNVYSIIAAIRPDLLEGSMKLVLPIGTQIEDKKTTEILTYPSLVVNEEVSNAVSNIGIELPFDMIEGFKEIYTEYKSVYEKQIQTNNERIESTEKKLKQFELYKDPKKLAKVKESKEYKDLEKKLLGFLDKKQEFENNKNDFGSLSRDNQKLVLNTLKKLKEDNKLEYSSILDAVQMAKNLQVPVNKDIVAETEKKVTPEANKEATSVVNKEVTPTISLVGKFGENYLKLANGDTKMAEIFAKGELEIINNPKVSEKRLERIIKGYKGALLENLDNDGKGLPATITFLEKYIPETVKEFAQLGGEFKSTYGIITGNQKLAKLDEKSAKLDEEGYKLNEELAKVKEELTKEKEELAKVNEKSAKIKEESAKIIEEGKNLDSIITKLSLQK